jgi:ribosomal protein L3
MLRKSIIGRKVGMSQIFDEERLYITKPYPRSLNNCCTTCSETCA